MTYGRKCGLLIVFLLAVLASQACGNGDAEADNESSAVPEDHAKKLVEEGSPGIREMIFLVDVDGSDPFPTELGDCEIYAVNDGGQLVVSIWPKSVTNVERLRPLPLLDSAKLREGFVARPRAEDVAAEGTAEDLGAWERFKHECSVALGAGAEFCVDAWDWVVVLQQDIRDSIGEWWDSSSVVKDILFGPLIASVAYLSDAVRFASAEGYLVSFLTQVGLSEEKAQTVADCVDLIYRLATTIFKKAEKDLWNLMGDLLQVVLHPIDAIGDVYDGLKAIYELACVAFDIQWSQWLLLLDEGLDAVVRQVGSTDLSADELVFAITNEDALPEMREEAFATVAYAGIKVTAGIVAGGAAAKLGASLFKKIRSLTKALTPEGKFALAKGWPHLPREKLMGVGVDSSLRRLQDFATGYRGRFRRALPDFPSDGLHDVHHGIPKSAYANLVESQTDSVNLLKNFRGVERSVHVQITREWNAFAKANPQPTLAAVTAEVERIDLKYASKMRFPPPEAVVDDYVEYAAMKGRTVTPDEKAGLLTETRAYQDRVRGINSPGIEPGEGG